MKTCPVCQATLFDDMDVCYGCMHEFGAGETAPMPANPPSELSPTLGAERSESGEATTPISLMAKPLEEPVAGRHARPRNEGAREEGRGARLADFPWTVRFEMRSRDDPAESWAMELVPAGKARARKAEPATASRGTTPGPRLAAGR